jgi:hypothetical protein
MRPEILLTFRKRLCDIRFCGWSPQYNRRVSHKAPTLPSRNRSFKHAEIAGKIALVKQETRAIENDLTMDGTCLDTFWQNKNGKRILFTSRL